MNTQAISIKTIGSPNIGYLSFYESTKDIPFKIKRVYYIHDVPNGVRRGMHAHKELKQVLWCPYGEIDIILDNGRTKEIYTLGSPEKAILLGNGIWRELIWRKEGSVLCVAASEYYNEEDYIRDYDDFLKYVEEGYWKGENKL